MTRPRAVVCAAIVMVASVACAAVAATSTSGARVRGVVLFIGDSNIQLGSTAIDEALSSHAHRNNGYVPVVASRIGSAIRSADCVIDAGCATHDYWKVREAAIRRRVQPNAVVTELGINDTGSIGTATTVGWSYYGTKIDWFMGLQSNVPVLWTTLPCALEPALRQAGCRVVNAALVAAMKRWPNLVVVDWAQVADGHPEYMTDCGQPGAVHYSDAGLEAWATVVVAALDARLVAV